MEGQRRMRRAGLGLLAVGIMFWLALAIEQMVGGETGGWVFLLPAVILAPLLYFAVRTPRAVGITLLAIAVATAALGSVVDPLAWEGSLLALFPLASGALLIVSSREGP